MVLKRGRVIAAAVVACVVLQATLALRLTEVRIPSHVIRDSSPRLECHYDLDGEALYSVKWYKDGHEFYRYVPRDMPPAQVFGLPGINVDLNASTDTAVVLQSVDLVSSGRFRCEVSAEAPSFQTVSEHGDVVVVALPEEGPRITGGRPRYQIGDVVRVNCTAGRSKPAAELNWFINGESADPELLRGPHKLITGREGLETTILGLQFRVRPRHFKKGDMKLKCLATISTVYWRSNEESVEGDKPQRAPVLESRETVRPVGSRADRVQASSHGTRTFGGHFHQILTILCCFLATFAVVASTKRSSSVSANVDRR
ncbi:uncharacterized protein LOC113368157 [Ctenocephalides felis]|uniref:uncharacterized protein LOC113368157 n=1 Tax=Ctenocephalides felis TaxID=7515 RepID=UPI000E6E2DDC|nr:uncharacterized protein LOC113368157 [Ctenocephalides felis]XP_026465511.1 uncharacterized protein LOC113368157 [Ctenocephalides felis]